MGRLERTMERLTKRYESGGISIKGCTSVYSSRERKGAFLNNAIARLAAYEDAMPLERARELAQAGKDGRLAILPCKAGDVVYEANKRGFISTYKVISIHLSDCSMLIGWELIDGIYSNLNGFEASALGKTVFLTRKEAEAALKKRGADNEAD